MANLNNDFMEYYKHLDKICREIFNSEKGVATYIFKLTNLAKIRTNKDNYALFVASEQRLDASA